MDDVLIRSAPTLREAEELIRTEAGRSAHLIHCERRGERSHTSSLRQSKCSQVDDDVRSCLRADCVRRGGGGAFWRQLFIVFEVVSSD